MRTISDDTAQTTPATKAKVQPSLQTFSTTISDGREITIREMTGRDLVYLEKDLAKEGEISKGMKIIERLIVSEDKITYEEILDLGVRDFRKLSELVSKANGGDEDESPN
jgi:uncharacterized protein YtpQ (UPF0354 family)